MCAVMGYSLHKVQYVHVCSNGVQFTRGSMHLTSILINDFFVNCDLYKYLIIHIATLSIKKSLIMK